MSRIVVISPGYNCSKWIPKMVNSLKSQTVENFKVFYVDDMSTDNSISVYKSEIGNDDRFVTLKNQVKSYSAGAHYNIINGDFGINDDDIIITIDADDWLPDSNVFKRVLSYYNNKNVWLTAGSYIEWRGTNGYGIYTPSDFIHRYKTILKNKNVDIRKTWLFTHLRTFKAFLFRKISRDDLIDTETGMFWKSAGDVAMMCPMAEMAGLKRFRLIANDVNYVYNVESNLNLHKIDAETQKNNYYKVVNKRKYELL